MYTSRKLTLPVLIALLLISSPLVSCNGAGRRIAIREVEAIATEGAEAPVVRNFTKKGVISLVGKAKRLIGLSRELTKEAREAIFASGYSAAENAEDAQSVSQMKEAVLKGLKTEAQNQKVDLDEAKLGEAAQDIADLVFKERDVESTGFSAGARSIYSDLSRDNVPSDDLKKLVYDVSSQRASTLGLSIDEAKLDKRASKTADYLSKEYNVIKFMLNAGIEYSNKQANNASLESLEAALLSVGKEEANRQNIEIPDSRLALIVATISTLIFQQQGQQKDS